VTTRIVYTDLDGTMVGPRGSFWHAADGSLTLEPAAALADLHRTGTPLVLVSGRTALQLAEAARIFSADGYVAELGSLVGWSRGWETQLLTGELPGRYAGRRPMDVLTDLGIVDRLLAEHPGRLEWHSPWHADHTSDAMLRGRVDPLGVDAWLAEQGAGWLTLKDNGAIPPAPRFGLDLDGAAPRVYHLMPRGISKGAAIGWDLQRRGLDPADAVAIGDSVSDLDMAPAVGRLWITANGAAADGMPELLAAVPNATVTDAPMGAGWAQAIRAALSS
jgi:hydroxymethylpyrimidine pyrophosphatase-like HAD family hydrolase